MLSGRVHVDMYIGEYGINTVGQGQHRRLVPNFNGGDYRARKSSPPPPGHRWDSCLAEGSQVEVGTMRSE